MAGSNDEANMQETYDVLGMVQRDRCTGAIPREAIALLCEASMLGRRPLLAELVVRNGGSVVDAFVQLCGAGLARSVEHFLRDDGGLDELVGQSRCGTVCPQASLDAWRALEAACASGSMDAVQLVRSRLGWQLHLLRDADDPAARGRAVAAARTVEIAETVTSVFGVTANHVRMAKALRAVCSRCDIVMCAWIIGRFELTDNDIHDKFSGALGAIGADAKSSSSDITALISVLAGKYAISPNELSGVVLRAYRRGDTRTVEWLLERYPRALSADIVSMMCEACDMAMLESISQGWDMLSIVFIHDDVLEACVRGGRSVVLFALRGMADSDGHIHMSCAWRPFCALGVLGDIQYYTDIYQILLRSGAMQQDRLDLAVFCWVLPYACERGHAGLARHIIDTHKAHLEREHVVSAMAAALCGGHITLAAEIAHTEIITRDEAAIEIQDQTQYMWRRYMQTNPGQLAAATPFYRVAASGNSAGLAWLYDHFDVDSSAPKSFDHSDIFIMACGAAGTDAAKWLAKRYTFDTRVAVSAVTGACIMSHGSTRYPTSGPLSARSSDDDNGSAEEDERLRLAKWICSEFSLTSADITYRGMIMFRACASHEREYIFRWLVETFRPAPDDFMRPGSDDSYGSVLSGVISRGSIGLLRWFFDTVDIRREHILHNEGYCISTVFELGDIEKLTFLAARFALSNSEIFSICRPFDDDNAADGYLAASDWLKSLIDTPDRTTLRK